MASIKPSASAIFTAVSKIPAVPQCYLIDFPLVKAIELGEYRMQNSFRTLSVSLFLFFLPGRLLAGDLPGSQSSEEYLVRTWQTDDGLPQNWVSSICQTADGYLWIGTRYGGLARFDGVRFASFNPENTRELKDVQVEHIQLDKTGTLWIIMGNESVTVLKDGQFRLIRLPRVEPRTRVEFFLNDNSNQVQFADEGGRLASIKLDGGTNSWELYAPTPAASDQGRSFWCDQAGVIWYLAHDGSLARFAGQKFGIYAADSKLPRTQFKALTADATGHLWAATGDRIFSWDGFAFKDETPTNQPSASNISQITPSPDGGLWVFGGNRLCKSWHGSWVADVPIPITVQRDNNSHSPQLYVDSEGNAWFIDYGHGLWHVKSDGSCHELTEKDGLPSAFISSWFQDRENNVWVGTAGGGLACIRKRVVHILSQEVNLPGKIARSVCEDKNGTLWVGTMSGGLARWKANQFEPLILPSYNPATPLESVTVCPANDGSLWIGSLRHGLMQLRNGKITRPISANDINSVRILFEDSKNCLWIGGLADLSCYSDGELRRFGPAEGFQSGVAIGNITEDALGAVWIGTGPGDLWKYEKNRFTRFSPPREWPSFRFAALRPDSDGAVWIGTLGGGLLRFKNGAFFRYTSELGLPNAYVAQLLDENQGYLWAGTYGGIVRFTKTNLNAVADGRVNRINCRMYGHSSGLQTLECSSGFEPSCWESSEGRLWWATANGLAYIDPKATITHHISPSVIIEEMQVDGQQRSLLPVVQDSPNALGGQNELQIEPGRHFVQFRFTGLSFEAPDEVQFRVRLDGAEKQWKDLYHQRTVGYGPLPPGHYRLQVQACNNEGLWSEQGASLFFAVLPFFWQTWWFKAGLIAFSFVGTWLLIIFILKRRHRMELQQLKYQHDLDRVRAQIAQDLHDDLGTSLTQISLLSALADRKAADDESKSFNLQIRERSREMVVALDEIVWAINPRNDSLSESINYLVHFAEEFFRPAAIRCRVDIPDDLPACQLSSETRHHLFLAFKESINNAARYSHASQVWLKVEIQSHSFIISIKDDGCGFSASEGAFQPGDGLLNIRSRMAQMGGRADIQSAPGLGTTVTLQLPFS